MRDCRLPRDLLKEYFAAVTELSYRSATCLFLVIKLRKALLSYGELFLFFLRSLSFKEKAEDFK